MAAAGDAAFESLYRSSWQRTVIATAMVLGDVTEAEDVVQEAFQRAAERWDVIRHYEDPEGWVRRVAHNLSIDILRRSRRRMRALVRLARHDNSMIMPPPELLDIHDAVRRLPERFRVVIAMHYVLDLSTARIAAELDMPEATVKSHLIRARQRLAALLADEGPRGGAPAADSRRALLRGPHD